MPIVVLDNLKDVHAYAEQHQIPLGPYAPGMLTRPFPGSSQASGHLDPGCEPDLVRAADDQVVVRTTCECIPEAERAPWADILAAVQRYAQAEKATPSRQTLLRLYQDFRIGEPGDWPDEDPSRQTIWPHDPSPALLEALARLRARDQTVRALLLDRFRQASGTQLTREGEETLDSELRLLIRFDDDHATNAMTPKDAGPALVIMEAPVVARAGSLTLRLIPADMRPHLSCYPPHVAQVVGHPVPDAPQEHLEQALLAYQPGTGNPPFTDVLAAIRAA